MVWMWMDVDLLGVRGGTGYLASPVSLLVMTTVWDGSLGPSLHLSAVRLEKFSSSDSLMYFISCNSAIFFILLHFFKCQSMYIEYAQKKLFLLYRRALTPYFLGRLATTRSPSGNFRVLRSHTITQKHQKYTKLDTIDYITFPYLSHTCQLSDIVNSMILPEK